MDEAQAAQLHNYVATEREKGYGEGAIRQKLLQSGWSEEQVTEAMMDDAPQGPPPKRDIPWGKIFWTLFKIGLVVGIIWFALTAFNDDSLLRAFLESKGILGKPGAGCEGLASEFERQQCLAGLG